MEIERKVENIIRTTDGEVLKKGMRVWYTKSGSEELFYGEFTSLNARNNLVMKNVITGNEVAIMPKCIESMYSKMPSEV